MQGMLDFVFFLISLLIVFFVCVTLIRMNFWENRFILCYPPYVRCRVFPFTNLQTPFSRTSKAPKKIFFLNIPKLVKIILGILMLHEIFSHNCGKAGERIFTNAMNAREFHFPFSYIWVLSFEPLNYFETSILCLQENRVLH